MGGPSLDLNLKDMAKLTNWGNVSEASAAGVRAACLIGGLVVHIDARKPRTAFHCSVVGGSAGRPKRPSSTRIRESARTRLSGIRLASLAVK
jgi:hypothetical protein